MRITGAALNRVRGYAGNTDTSFDEDDHMVAYEVTKRALEKAGADTNVIETVEGVFDRVAAREGYISFSTQVARSFITLYDRMTTQSERLYFGQSSETGIGLLRECVANQRTLSVEETAAVISEMLATPKVVQALIDDENDEGITHAMRELSNGVILSGSEARILLADYDAIMDTDGRRARIRELEAELARLRAS